MSLSKIVVSGRVVKAPEKRFTAHSNVAVTEFSLVVESAPRSDGNVESQPVKVITWRDLAERCAQEIKKGDYVVVDGRLQINVYTNSEGQRRRDAEIEATSVENLSSTLGNNADLAGAEQPEYTAKTAVGANRRSASAEEQHDDIDAIFTNEDEIPF